MPRCMASICAGMIPVARSVELRRFAADYLVFCRSSITAWAMTLEKANYVRSVKVALTFDRIFDYLHDACLGSR